MTDPDTHDPFTPEDAAHEDTRNRLAVNPDLRAEALATHYLKLASHGQQLKGFLTIKRRNGLGTIDRVAAEGLIRDCEADMIKAHWEAFGVKPGWTT